MAGTETGVTVRGHEAAAVVQGGQGMFSAFTSIQNFQDAQRMAQLLASSSLVPEQYRGNVANCVIGLEMANRIGASPLAVLQNLYIVHGRPAWSSQFLVACINASGRFSPMRYSVDGDGDDRGCVAWATDRTGERLESPRVTIKMAKSEGWFSKNGSKWQTMPELMLRYRAATLFARLYAPELTMGIHTDDEVIDITPVVTETTAPARPPAAAPIRDYSGRRAVAAAAPADEVPTEAQVANAIRESGVSADEVVKWASISGRTATMVAELPVEDRRFIVSDPAMLARTVRATLQREVAQ